MSDDTDYADDYRDWYAEDEPLDGAELLDDTKEFLSRFVAYPTDWALTAHALWIAHTHLMGCWESTPRIAFLSPEPASGKTRALEVSEPLVPRPVHAVNTTPAYLFRKVSDPDGLPTILYDEIDTVFGPRAKEHEDVRGMLNAGHRNGAVAGRCVVRGRNIDTEDLPAYCAVAMAGLDDLPDTIMSRSVVIRMRRRAPTEALQPWRHRINGPEGEKLRGRLAAWAAIVERDARQLWPQLPDGIEDRNADVWEPLLAVAELAGGHWPDTAAVAAVAAVAASKGDKQSLGVLLLHDIRNVFRKHDTDRLCSALVITELRGIEESPWNAINRDGSALNAQGLAQRLRKYGIKSENMRDDAGKVVKGYPRVKFTDAWSRYLDDDEHDAGKDNTSDEPAGRDSGNDGQQALSLSPNKRATAATAATATTTKRRSNPTREKDTDDRLLRVDPGTPVDTRHARPESVRVRPRRVGPPHSRRSTPDPRFFERCSAPRHPVVPYLFTAILGEFLEFLVDKIAKVVAYQRNWRNHGAKVAAGDQAPGPPQRAAVTPDRRRWQV